MTTASTRKLPLQGKVVIISGAGCGIGRDLAKLFASSGACVVATDLDVSKAQDAIRDLPGCYGAYCDPDDEFSRRDLVERAVSKFGRIDAVVDSAAFLYAETPIENAA